MSEKLIEGLREQHRRDSAELRRLCAERDQLKGQIERLKKHIESAWEDAERYRWLRDEARTNRAPHIFQYPAQSFDRPQYPHFKDVGLDAAIDAARKEAPID